MPKFLGLVPALTLADRSAAPWLNDPAVFDTPLIVRVPMLTPARVTAPVAAVVDTLIFAFWNTLLAQVTWFKVAVPDGGGQRDVEHLARRRSAGGRS